MSPSRQRAEQEGGQNLRRRSVSSRNRNTQNLLTTLVALRRHGRGPRGALAAGDAVAERRRHGRGPRGAKSPATRWPSDDEAPRRREDSPRSEEFESEDSSSSSEAVRLRLPPRRAERRREVRPRRIVDSDSEEDSSSSGLGGGAEITKNLYSVQVQMIKKVVNEEKVFLDYEIHRELKKDTSNISIIEKSFFNLSLIHHFATEALEISLKDNVGTEKVKKWKGSILNKQRIRVPVSDRTTRRGSTSQNVKSVKTSWWSNIKNLTQKSVINNDGRKIPLPSKSRICFRMYRIY